MGFLSLPSDKASCVSHSLDVGVMGSGEELVHSFHCSGGLNTFTVYLPLQMGFSFHKCLYLAFLVKLAWWQ